MIPTKNVLKKPAKRPLFQTLRAVTGVVPGVRPWVQRNLIFAGYQFVNSRARNTPNTFMNYGFASLDGDEPALTLNEEEKERRYSVYLYNRVARAVDLHGRDVLEVGCGRGGGSAFLKHQFEARSVTGIDFASRAIEFCNRYHHLDGLTFTTGDADQIPFASESFDAVVSVESSHCYPDIDGFLREANRVLRPSGYLLLADFRGNNGFDALRARFERAGFTIVEDESIIKNVVHALDLDGERRRQAVDRHFLKPLRRTMLEFAGVSGSRIYTDFTSGKCDYRCFAMVKR